MKAAVLDAETSAVRIASDLPKPNPRDNEILLRVKACGLSHFDTHGQRIRKEVAGLSFEPAKQGQAAVTSEVSAPRVSSISTVGFDVAGVVEAIGSGVKGFQVGDDVCGILPLDSIGSGCAELCCVPCTHIVAKPGSVPFVEAAAALSPGVFAFTALLYQCRIVAGEWLCVLNAASPSGIALVQLGKHLGARIMAVVSSSDEAAQLNEVQALLARVVDTSTDSLSAAALEESGGVGIDCIVEAPPCSTLDEESATRWRREIFRCLAAAGRYATARSDVQVEPPEAELLYLKSAQVSFVNEQWWLLSCSQQGRFLHILEELMTQVQKGVIKPRVQKAFALDNAHEAVDIAKSSAGGSVVVKIA